MTTGSAVRTSTRWGELVRLDGEHDVSTAGAVGALIRQAASQRPRMVVVDVTAVRFIDLAIGHEVRRVALEFAEVPFAIAYDADSQARAVVETLFPESHAPVDEPSPPRDRTSQAMTSSARSPRRIRRRYCGPAWPPAHTTPSIGSARSRSTRRSL